MQTKKTNVVVLNSNLQGADYSTLILGKTTRFTPTPHLLTSVIKICLMLILFNPLVGSCQNSLNFYSAVMADQFMGNIGVLSNDRTLISDMDQFNSNRSVFAVVSQNGSNITALATITDNTNINLSSSVKRRNIYTDLNGNPTGVNAYGLSLLNGKLFRITDVLVMKKNTSTFEMFICFNDRTRYFIGRYAINISNNAVTSITIATANKLSVDYNANSMPAITNNNMFNFTPSDAIKVTKIAANKTTKEIVVAGYGDDYIMRDNQGNPNNISGSIQLKAIRALNLLDITNTFRTTASDYNLINYNGIPHHNNLAGMWSREELDDLTLSTGAQGDIVNFIFENKHGYWPDCPDNNQQYQNSNYDGTLHTGIVFMKPTIPLGQQVLNPYYTAFSNPQTSNSVSCFYQPKLCAKENYTSGTYPSFSIVSTHATTAGQTHSDYELFYTTGDDPIIAEQNEQFLDAYSPFNLNLNGYYQSSPAIAQMSTEGFPIFSNENDKRNGWFNIYGVPEPVTMGYVSIYGPNNEWVGCNKTSASAKLISTISSNAATRLYTIAWSNAAGDIFCKTKTFNNFSLRKPKPTVNLLAIQPNPSNGNIVVTTPSNNGNLHITNIMGANVYNTIITKTKTVLQIQCQPGVYNVQFMDSDTKNMSSEKIIIQ